MSDDFRIINLEFFISPCYEIFILYKKFKHTFLFLRINVFPILTNLGSSSMPRLYESHYSILYYSIVLLLCVDLSQSKICSNSTIPLGIVLVFKCIIPSSSSSFSSLGLSSRLSSISYPLKKSLHIMNSRICWSSYKT